MIQLLLGLPFSVSFGLSQSCLGKMLLKLPRNRCKIPIKEMMTQLLKGRSSSGRSAGVATEERSVEGKHLTCSNRNGSTVGVKKVFFTQSPMVAPEPGCKNSEESGWRLT